MDTSHGRRDQSNQQAQYLGIITLSNGYEAIEVKWIFKIKKNASGDVQRYKVRLIAKSYKQKLGVDYEEVFVPIARIETIHLIISLAAQIK